MQYHCLEMCSCVWIFYYQLFFLVEQLVLHGIRSCCLEFNLIPIKFEFTQLNQNDVLCRWETRLVCFEERWIGDWDIWYFHIKKPWRYFNEIWQDPILSQAKSYPKKSEQGKCYPYWCITPADDKDMFWSRF